jgi:hypothetical protein
LTVHALRLDHDPGNSMSTPVNWLLVLPRELRDLIYEYTLTEDGGLILDCFTEPSNLARPRPANGDSFREACHLALVCRYVKLRMGYMLDSLWLLSFIFAAPLCCVFLSYAHSLFGRNSFAISVPEAFESIISSPIHPSISSGVQYQANCSV